MIGLPNFSTGKPILMKSYGTFLKALNRWLILLAIQIPALLQAQVLFEMLPSTLSDGTINIYGRGTLSNKISLDRIKGSAFWSDEWKAATLYGKNPKEKWEQPIKLNLATNEIYFKTKDNEELVIGNVFVQKIVFHQSDDPSKTETVFLNGTPEPYITQNKISGFVQVLNDGRYQLLKQSLRKVAEADSLFGTLKKYFFTHDTKYFIADRNAIVPINKLNRENCLAIGGNKEDNLAWISRNKIDLRKEADVVKFLNHLNEIN